MRIGSLTGNYFLKRSETSKKQRTLVRRFLDVSPFLFLLLCLSLFFPEIVDVVVDFLGEFGNLNYISSSLVSTIVEQTFLLLQAERYR